MCDFILEQKKFSEVIFQLNTPFDITDPYQSTSAAETFLFCDTLVDRKKRMLIFASSKQLELPFNSSGLFMNGIF